jgi:hypothetical protein
LTKFSDRCQEACQGVVKQTGNKRVAINAMGLHFLDWLRFDDLAAVFEEPSRWSFLCVVALLRLGAGTGSPVNPIAIF